MAARTNWLVLSCLSYARVVAQPVMEAHFLPVGQAHATLLEFSCGAALIDAGAQDDESVIRLLSYLDQFFERRTDLKRTLDLVLVTHNHIDHTRGLRSIVDRDPAQRVNIRMYVDTGQLFGMGTENPRWIRDNAHTGGRDIQVREVTFNEISALPTRNGLTDSVIDPVACSGVDPQIRVLYGRHKVRPPGWSQDDFANKNNHSIVTRIDFGAASFLFTGDLEEKGIAGLLAHYGDPASVAILNADVYQVGHHGSNNATNKALLDAVTPAVAVIPAGNWDFGKEATTVFHTNAFGHPRKKVLDLLSDAITADRGESVTVMAASGVRKFVPYVVRRRIYATSWDGVVRVTAASDGSITVSRQ